MFVGDIRKPKGRKPKNNDFTPLTHLLFKCGWTMPQICKELGISKEDFKTYFTRPTLFNLERLKVLCWMTGEKWGVIAMLCLGIDSANVHWFDEHTSKTARERVEEIKNEKLNNKTE